MDASSLQSEGFPAHEVDHDLCFQLHPTFSGDMEEEGPSSGGKLLSIMAVFAYPDTSNTADELFELEISAMSR